MDTKTEAAVADYAMFLAEAAYVLSALAEAPTDGRRDEFIILQSVYAESTSNPVAHSDEDGLPILLRSMMSSVMATGAVLTPYDDDELPLTAIAGVHIVESMCRAISQALEADDPRPFIPEILRGARTLASTPAVNTTNLVAAIRFADATVTLFVRRICSINP